MHLSKQGALTVRSIFFFAPNKAPLRIGSIFDGALIFYGTFVQLVRMSLVCEDKNSCLSQKIHADSQWKTNNQQNGAWVQNVRNDKEENPLFNLTFYLESSKHAPRTDRIFARRATILIAISLNPPKVAPNFTKALHDRLDYRVDFVQFRHCWTSHLFN